MRLAEGIAEALALEFANDTEAAAFWNDAGPQVPYEDLTYPNGAGAPQMLRLYRGAPVSGPVLLYIHGGGWVGGSVALHDYSARGLAAGAGYNVVSISYRLAPEHPYPKGLEDCIAACDWITQHGGDHGLEPAHIVIGGASAGGNLAAAAALAKDPGRLAGLLIYYGVLGHDFDTASYLRYAEGPGLTRARMREFFDLYDPTGRAKTDPLITPLLSQGLGQLPPTCIIAAEHDVLLDDNRAFAQALEAAGVATDFYTQAGAIHGFINRGRLAPVADVAISHAAGWLRGIATQGAST